MLPANSRYFGTKRALPMAPAGFEAPKPATVVEPLVPGAAVLEFQHLSYGYQLKSELGTGTFGTVHKAHSAKLNGALVAVKTLKDTAGVNPYELREVQFFERVPAHDNLVNLYEMFSDPADQQVHFAMELMDYSLLDLVKGRKGRPFSVRTTVNIASQLLRGIAHIHAHGYIHRDLKPENILVSSGATRSRKGETIVVKIADFGLSRMADTPGDHSRWTAYVATRWYRAPEQLLGLKYHTYAIDIWSFGLLLFEIANLVPLFPGKDPSDMLRRQIKVLGSPGGMSPGGPWQDAAVSDIQLARSMFLGGEYYGMHIGDYCRYPEAMVFGKIWLACLAWDPKRRHTPGQLLSKLMKLGSTRTARAPIVVRPSSAI